MYDENFKISSRYANSTRAFVNAAIENYNEATAIEKPKKHTIKYEDEVDFVLENAMQRSSIERKYRSFSESVKNTLVIESLYKMFKESVTIDVTSTDLSIMRAMVGQYVTENGYDTILTKMKTASVPMSNIHNIIIENAKMIMETVDKNDPDTFTVTPEMKDEFFKQLDYNDPAAISDAIKDRVSAATKDFVDANVKDHEDIENVLQNAQDCIAKTDEEDTELKEFYEMKARRQVHGIRNSAKNVLHKMIYSMSETVVKHPKEYAEFLEDGHINMDKVVSRTTLMYTFMEMLNTARLAKVDKVFIESVIQGLCD